MRAALLNVLLLLVTLAVTHGCFRSSGGGTTPRPSFPHDITTQAGLTRLYNERVTRAELMSRPLDNFKWKAGWVSHSGVVVTVGDGSRWLIHKGDGYGISSQTVVTDARHMSPRWSHVRSRSVRYARVTDYVRVGGSGYSWSGNNCHHASGRMMNLN